MSRKYSTLTALSVAATLVATAPYADARRSDQEKARQQMQAGQTKSLAELKRIVENYMGSKSITSDFDASSNIYKFKFWQSDSNTQKRRIVYIYIDARSGVILNRR